MIFSSSGEMENYLPQKFEVNYKKAVSAIPVGLEM
jgi:hypothetical protein